MGAYYNEHDLFAAQWLRNLIATGHIAPGEVDTRSIEDVTSDDLRGFQQCHFFAGIGIWSRALRDAGWPDDRVVWTGSCPCQPFSAAGKGAGFTDERHLWPAWHHLIAECRPPVVLGEQVASALGWLDLVSTDMEAAGYAFGASDLCAAGFGGAHIRQRLYFVGVGDTLSARRPEGRAEPGSGSAADTGAVGGLAFSNGGDSGPERQQRSGEQRQQPQDGSVGRMGDSNSVGEDSQRELCEGENPDAERGLAAGRLADDDDSRPQGWAGVSERGDELSARAGGVETEPRPAHAPLLGRHAVDWLYCRDAKWRPVEPGTFPLADAAPQRVGRLRAYGNGLDLETATGFVGAVMDALGSS